MDVHGCERSSLVISLNRKLVLGRYAWRTETGQDNIKIMASLTRYKVVMVYFEDHGANVSSGIMPACVAYHGGYQGRVVLDPADVRRA